jgi:hypothetical protein
LKFVHSEKDYEGGYLDGKYHGVGTAYGWDLVNDMASPHADSYMRRKGVWEHGVLKRGVYFLQQGSHVFSIGAYIQPLEIGNLHLHRDYKEAIDTGKGSMAFGYFCRVYERRGKLAEIVSKPIPVITGNYGFPIKRNW